MGRYWVTEPCAFAEDGKGVYYRTVPREPVELSDDVAESLGDKVRPFETSEDSEEPAKKSRRRRKAEESPSDESEDSSPVEEESRDSDAELRS
jgi:hypothetical protein